MWATMAQKMILESKKTKDRNLVGWGFLKGFIVVNAAKLL